MRRLRPPILTPTNPRCNPTMKHPDRTPIRLVKLERPAVRTPSELWVFTNTQAVARSKGRPRLGSQRRAGGSGHGPRRARSRPVSGHTSSPQRELDAGTAIRRYRPRCSWGERARSGTVPAALGHRPSRSSPTDAPITGNRAQGCGVPLPRRRSRCRCSPPLIQKRRRSAWRKGP